TDRISFGNRRKRRAGSLHAPRRLADPPKACRLGATTAGVGGGWTALIVHVPAIGLQLSFPRLTDHASDGIIWQVPGRCGARHRTRAWALLHPPATLCCAKVALGQECLL